MEEEQKSSYSGTIDIKFYLLKGLKYWWILAILLGGSYVGSYIYLRYQSTDYQSSIEIMVRDSKNRNHIESIVDNYALRSGYRNLKNEIQYLKSTEVIGYTLDKINLFIDYKVLGSFKVNDAYHTSLYEITPDTTMYIPSGVVFNVKPTTKGKFLISYSGTVVFLDKKYRFTDKKPLLVRDSVEVIDGGIVRIDSCEFTFKMKEKNKLLRNNKYQFNFFSHRYLVKYYKKALRVRSLDGGESSILTISLVSKNKHKSKDFLNALCDSYLELDVKEKDDKIDKSINFIDNQLRYLSSRLKNREDSLLSYKKDVGYADLHSVSQLSVTRINEYKTLITRANFSLNYYKYLQEYVNKNKNADNMMSPSVVGIEDGNLTSKVTELLNLYQEKAVLDYVTNKDNPSIQILDLKIQNVKKSIVGLLGSLIDITNKKISSLKNQIKGDVATLSKVPKNERKLVALQRDLGIVETMYEQLLIKRVEAVLSKSLNTPDNKILNYAFLDEIVVVGPDIKGVKVKYLVGAVIFFCVFMYFKLFYHEKLTNLSGLHKLLEIAENRVLYVPKYIEREEMFRSPFFESIRLLRVKLQEKLSVDSKSKIIVVTSSISGEGKTVISKNLATSYAMSGKKTVVLGCDLRKPTLSKLFKLESSIGITNYLVNSISPSDILFKSKETNNLFIVPSGPIPDNPVELLSSDKYHLLIKYLRDEFDTIIIDTPPINLVSDYFTINQLADYTLYVSRYNYTLKSIIEGVKKKMRGNNYTFLVNDIEDNQDGYGYYSYGEEPEKKIGFLSRIKKTINS